MGWGAGAYAVIRCQEGGLALSREGCRATLATFLPRAAFPSGAAVTVPRLPGRRDPSAVPAASLPSFCQGWAGRCGARSLPGFRARARAPSPRVPHPARARAPRRPVPAVSLSCPPAAIAGRAARAEQRGRSSALASPSHRRRCHLDGGHRVERLCSEGDRRDSRRTQAP